MLEFYKMKICNFWQSFVNYFFDPVRHERVALVVCTVYPVVLMLEFSFLMFFLAKLLSVTESTQVYS